MRCRTPRISLTLLLLAVVSLSACAAIRASRARNAHLQRKTQQHVYDQPCKHVWPEARRILFKAGYSVKDTGRARSMTVETEWKFENDERSRYLVQGMQPSEGTCKVRFERMEESESGYTSTSRDWQLEWQLLQRIDPQAAAKIREVADQKAARAQ